MDRVGQLGGSNGIAVGIAVVVEHAGGKFLDLRIVQHAVDAVIARGGRIVVHVEGHRGDVAIHQAVVNFVSEAVRADVAGVGSVREATGPVAFAVQLQLQ